MEDNFKKMSPIQLMSTFCNYVDKKVISYENGTNPFIVKVNGQQVYIYIKNLSPAQLSNNNPDVWRIQLPIKDEFEKIKESDNMFILLGYDAENEVYTSWNPYWCKQRLNVGKSVSLYSRLSLQTKVSKSGKIERYNLQNEGEVVCIPKRKIGEFVIDIKKYYPEETTFVAHGSSIQKKFNKTALKVFEGFKAGISNPDRFRKFMLDEGMSESASNNYARHISNLFSSGLIDSHRDCFLEHASLSSYDKAIYNFLQIKEISAIDSKSHGYYRAGLRNYLDFLLLSQLKGETTYFSEIIQDEAEKTDPAKSESPYPLDENKKLISLDDEIRAQLAIYAADEYPDYDEMIKIATEYYSDKIPGEMTYIDWFNLLKNTNWKKAASEKKGAPRVRVSRIRVTRPDGSVIDHARVVDTYEEVIKENIPELIQEIGITHAGVNIVSTQYDEKYKKYQKQIGDGYLLFVNSSTKNKYKDLQTINEELGLGLKIELIDIDSESKIQISEKSKEHEGEERTKIKVTFPDGTSVQHSPVLKTLLAVVEYAGPARVAELNIIVNRENMMSRKPYERYKVACKEVSGGWYVNTNTSTEQKFEQICHISKSFNLGLKVDLV